MNSGVDLEWRGNVALITLNDPTTLNALRLDTIAAFAGILDEVDERARAMVLTGAGRAFCSGANLSGMDKSASGDAPDLGRALGEHINPLMQRLHDLGVPWIDAR